MNKFVLCYTKDIFNWYCKKFKTRKEAEEYQDKIKNDVYLTQITTIYDFLPNGVNEEMLSSKINFHIDE
jgi:hypothetical protein